MYFNVFQYIPNLHCCILLPFILFSSTQLCAQTPPIDPDNPPHWVLFSKSNSPLPANRITALAQDHDGIVYAAMGTRMYAYNGEVWKNLQRPKGWSSSDKVIKMVFDPINTGWAVTQQGRIAFFFEEEWTELTPKNSGLPGNRKVSDVAIDSKNNKWISTLGGGIIKYDDTEFFSYDSLLDELGDSTFYALSIDKNDVIWILGSSGLIRFTGDTSFHRMPHFQYSFPPGQNYSFVAAPPQQFWTGGGNSLSVTSGGISYFDGRTVTHYTTRNSNLLTNCVNTLARDPSGMIWAGCGNVAADNLKDDTKSFYRGGITRLGEPQVGRLNDSFLRFVASVETHLNDLPGLQSQDEIKNRARSITAILIDLSNNKWIGTENGLFVYNEKGVMLK